MIKRLVFWVLIAIPIYAMCQFPGGSATPDSVRKFRMMVIPYIDYNRSVEFSYGVIPMAMFPLNKSDTISPSSMAGLMWMRTTNATQFSAFFSRLYLKEDNYRITVAGGAGNVNFQFYPDIPVLPEVVDYSTSLDFFMLEGQKKIAKHQFAGVGYIYLNIATDFDLEMVPTQFTELNGLRLVYSYDKRDDVYYPYDGFYGNLNYNFFPGWMGNTQTSDKIEIDYNQYFGMKNERDVIAGRVFIGIGIGELDFNQQFILGGTDLRGYSLGEFRGEQLYAVQGEYRWNMTPKFGLVGFFGVGTVVSEDNPSNSGKLLPGAGGGFRVNVFPENHLNVGIDAGVGNNDWSVEFRIGEAF